jgi:hypothetical protein
VRQSFRDYIFPVNEEIVFLLLLEHGLFEINSSLCGERVLRLERRRPPFHSVFQQSDILLRPLLKVDTPNGRLHTTRRTTLNDTAAELLVKQKAMEVHGSLEQMQEMRRLEYRETQRQHRKVVGIY